jgi:hypothetical protein
MTNTFAGAVLGIAIAVCAAYTQDNDLESVMKGARLLYVQNQTLYSMEVGIWEKTALFSPCGNGDAVRWAATGQRALVASGTAVTVIDVNTKQPVYTKSGLSINYVSTADPAADISYDGTTIYFVQGNNIKAIDIATDKITTIYTTKSASQITEGELCVSGNGKRFVGRQSNACAVYVDIEKGIEGQYAQECSPAISPSGTILAVNQDGHQYIKTFNWPLASAAPVEWRRISIAGKGKWDNQTWSNHEDYYVGNGDGGDCKIVNVRTQDVYTFGHSTLCEYPDLWIPGEAGGSVPGTGVGGAVHPSGFSGVKTSRPSGMLTGAGLTTRTALPHDKAFVSYSLSGRKKSDLRNGSSVGKVPSVDVIRMVK